MINFLKHTNKYLFLSASLVIFSIFFILKFGFVYSIDFVGGGLLEFVAEKPVDFKKINTIYGVGDGLDFQQTSKGFIIKGVSLNKKRAQVLAKEIEKNYPVRQERYELVGAGVSNDNIFKISTATLLAIITILIYVAFSFKKVSYGLSAIGALLHDTIILLGSWSVLGYFFGAEFNLLFVTAILTTMSFSVHDTIVIFDKVKEEEKGNYTNMDQVLNSALTLTMMRSLNNSITIVLMLTALIILGGGSIQWFAVSLLIGTLAGTYSSPFVATPLFSVLTKKTQR
jgi:preprotein translocase subunit SecF